MLLSHAQGEGGNNAESGEVCVNARCGELDLWCLEVELDMNNRTVNVGIGLDCMWTLMAKG